MAIATNTTPAQWLAEDDITIVTAMELLRERDRGPKPEEYDGD